MTGALAVSFAAFGLAFGSFLTVAVHRLPRGASLVRPRSACPGCGGQILARDNVPVLSYLLLRGRCRACGSHISAEYPTVEAVTAALFVAPALVFSSVWVAALIAPFLGVMFAAALIDARHRIIPNGLTYPALVLFAAAIVASWVAGVPVSPVGALTGCLAFGLPFLAVALISPSGMGMGDVKLGALIGLVLGSLGMRYVAVAVAVAVLAGGIGGLVALMAGRRRKDTIPFGPYLAGGAITAALAAPQMAAWYGGLVR